MAGVDGRIRTGPGKKGMHPDIYPANAFVGNYLRLDVLTRYGLKERCLQEIEGYFYYMAEKPERYGKILPITPAAITVLPVMSLFD